MLTTIQKNYRAIEPAIIVILLLYIIGVWWYPKITNYDSQLADNDLLRTSLNLGLYGFTFVSLLTNWQNCLRLLVKDKILVSLILLVLLSLLWSVDTAATVDYMKGLVRITALAVYIASRFTIRQQMALVKASLLIAAILSLLMCIILPEQGIQISWGTLDGWRGVFFHKNILGRSMAFGSGVWLLGALNNRNSGGNQWLSWAAFLLCFTLLILSNSKTGLISFFFMLPLFALNKINKQKSYSLRMVLLHIGFLLIGGGTIVAASAYEPILDALGKEVTLTGRIPLWTVLWDKFLQRPFLGYGYNAFWDGPDGLEVESIFTWAGHAHNGFYEVALATGVIGLSLLLINFFKNYSRAISYAKSSSNLNDLWPAQIFTMLFFVNMTVGTTFLAIDFVWLFYVAIDLSLANQSYQQHQEQKLDRRRSREELLFSYLDQ